MPLEWPSRVPTLKGSFGKFSGSLKPFGRRYLVLWISSWDERPQPDQWLTGLTKTCGIGDSLKKLRKKYIEMCHSQGGYKAGRWDTREVTCRVFSG